MLKVPEEAATVGSLQLKVRANLAGVTTGVDNQICPYFQILRYEKGQFYRVHHDQNSPMTSAWGPRMYTFFM